MAAKKIKVCQICGKQYEYCYTARMPGTWRWQDVTCSQECGAKFFDLVFAKQNQTQDTKEKAGGQ